MPRKSGEDWKRGQGEREKNKIFREIRGKTRDDNSLERKKK